MYRVTSVTCLCNGVLEETTPGRMGCVSCGHVLVSVESFLELMRVVAPDAVLPRRVLAFPSRGARPRPCPLCKKPMVRGVLFEQAVEQCTADGLFLHRDTLTKITLIAAERYERRFRERSK